MKQRSRLSLRDCVISCVLFAAISLLVCLVFSWKRERHAFHDFCSVLYEREMASNALSLHYSLADPARFGINDYPVTLPRYLPKSELSRSEWLSKTLEKLQSLSSSRLSGEELYAKEALEKSLSLSLALSHYPYYSDPLSGAQGIQGELPILFCEYCFRTRRDVDEYLELLSQIGDFYNSLLLYEQEKTAAGLAPSLESLKKAQEQCDTIVTSKSLESGGHFLQTSFRERLSKLAKSESFTDQELRDYVAKNDVILKEIFLPACQALKRGLGELEPFASPESLGLAARPHGREYYAALLAVETGSSKTPKEACALLEQVLIRECEAISNLSKAYPEFAESSDDEALFPKEYDAGVILQDLKERIAEDFPALQPAGSITGTFPEVTVKTVMPSLQEISAPAFYLTSPLDDTSHNVIYVNPLSTPEGLELYTTLAHEGFPGHLYQNACSAERILSLRSEDARRLRQLVSCGGFLEGWAVYAEQTAHDYAAQLLADRGQKAGAVRAIIEKHRRSLMLCLYSLLDVKIHYDGAGLEEVAELLEPFGIRDAATISAIYEYVCQTPCNYPKYYLGYLEILELKKEAKLLWGEDFSLLRFHEFLLDWGPADFETLKKKLLE